MQIHIAIVHPIGEDNDSTFCVVARSKEALLPQIVEACNDWEDGGEGEPPRFADWADFEKNGCGRCCNWSVVFEERELED